MGGKAQSTTGNATSSNAGVLSGMSDRLISAEHDISEVMGASIMAPETYTKLEEARLKLSAVIRQLETMPIVDDSAIVINSTQIAHLKSLREMAAQSAHSAGAQGIALEEDSKPTAALGKYRLQAILMERWLALSDVLKVLSIN